MDLMTSSGIILTIRLNTLTCDAKSRSKWETLVLLKACGPRINVNRKQKKIKVKDWTFKEHEHNKSFNKRWKIEQALNKVFIILFNCYTLSISILFQMIFYSDLIFCFKTNFDFGLQRKYVIFIFDETDRMREKEKCFGSNTRFNSACTCDNCKW